MRVTEPYVSVIIPAYNVAGCLERALNSVLDQTLADFEVIVVNDASEDKTLEVAHRVASRDPRIIVLSNERNKGVSVSRNRAIDAARGEWVAILDADDAWLPERLEQMMAYAEDADVISDDIWLVCKSYFRPRKRVFLRYFRDRGLAQRGPKGLSMQEFLWYDLGALKPIFRRSFLDRYRISYSSSLSISEDFHFSIEVLASGARWVQLPWAYYLYIDDRADRATSDIHMLWKSSIESSKALYDHTIIVENPELAAALNHRIRKGHEAIVIDTVRSTVRQHRFVELATAVTKQPTMVWAVVKFVLARLYLRWSAELQTLGCQRLDSCERRRELDLLVEN